MPSCLGIYIQNNLIKYAKISKEHNITKVEAYGVKFYETDLEKAIEQIVGETFSYQVPISINIDKEKYTYADVFNLLKPQDLEKAIDTEFEFFCNSNNKNKNTIEFRKIKTPNMEDRDRVRVIYSYIEKANVVERMQLFDAYKIANISPIATTLPNLNKMLIQDRCAIVNIEEETEITTIVNGNVYKVDRIEPGMGRILKTIGETENSVNKAYEICKNTTVYTKTGQNLKIEGNEYLDEIITALLEIIEKVKETLEKNEVDVNNIYITGMGLIINNIDLLFQENFINKKCEIFIPSFVEKTNVKINIKDYIEINSAIALALQGLETKKQPMNFSNKGANMKKVLDFLNQDVGKKNKTKAKEKKPKLSFKEVMHSDLDMLEKMLLRSTTMLLLIIILYISATSVLAQKIQSKMDETDALIQENNNVIASIQTKNTLIEERTASYQTIIDQINETNQKITENYSSRNAIPNLLNKIMYNIPKGVQLLSVKNTSDKTITIVAQAEKYDQLGYFKAVLEEEGILNNIVTTKGVKQNELINITITGELPY